MGLRHRFIERGSFLSFRALNRAVNVVKALNRRRRMPALKVRGMAKRARQAAYRGYYRLHLRLPVDDRLALYAAYWYRGVTCNPAAISSKAAELAPEVRNVWVVGRAGARSVPPGTDYVIAGSLPYYRALARARWLVNNVNWPNWVVKRDGATHLMTHHGTPLKMMGLDQADHPAAVKDPDFRAQMRRADRWDFSISANAHTTVAWERAYPCRYETLEVGYPRNDRLASASPAETAAVRARLGIAPSERVVLYTPTHREWLRLGERVLDVEAFAEALGPETVLLVRAHYFHVAPDEETRTRRGADRGRVGIPGGRGPLSGRRRDGHRLLLGDVRLRRARPAAGDLRARLGGVPGAARHLLRPDGTAAGSRRDDLPGVGRRLRRRRVLRR
nr:hypothetical protein GCM10020092_103720 [Actinoplanes digitatis]